MIATLSSKCQITIPKKVRVYLNLSAGSPVELIAEGGHVYLRPPGTSAVKATAGSLAAYAKNRRGRTEKEWLRDAARKMDRGKIPR